MNTDQNKVNSQGKDKVMTSYDEKSPASTGQYSSHSFHPDCVYSKVGSRIYRLEEVDSTNAWAIDRIGHGLENGAVIVAEKQLSGRGRFDRIWHSPDGKGLWFSIMIRVNIPIEEISLVTLLTAVAVAESIEEATGLKAGIKWPNDILVNGRKVCGILTELVENDDPDASTVVIGIGINVNMTHEDMHRDIVSRATSLAIESGKTLPREILLKLIINRMNFRIRQWLTEGFDPVRESWISGNVTTGNIVKVDSFNEQFCGYATGIDRDGSLIVLTEERELRKVSSGEVTLDSKDIRFNN